MGGIAGSMIVFPADLAFAGTHLLLLEGWHGKAVTPGVSTGSLCSPNTHGEGHGKYVPMFVRVR